MTLKGAEQLAVAILFVSAAICWLQAARTKRTTPEQNIFDIVRRQSRWSSIAALLVAAGLLSQMVLMLQR